MSTDYEADKNNKMASKHQKQVKKDLRSVPKLKVTKSKKNVFCMVSE